MNIYTHTIDCCIYTLLLSWTFDKRNKFTNVRITTCITILNFSYIKQNYNTNNHTCIHDIELFLSIILLIT